MIPSFEKIHHKNTVGNDGAVAFQVNTDPAIMKRLSDDVYQDPIGAIIRELSTNAFDAHIDANAQHVPFDIHLPTEVDQIYRIRDYGTGLSKENLLNMYTQYANSTRRDSNNHIGSIGIGSKSPFAYTSQFSVVSYYNGEKISALCYKDEHHMPYMQVLETETTTEANGLEIYFPVKPEDINVFKTKAVDILQWFKVRPNTNIPLDYTNCINENILVEEPNSWAFYTNIKFRYNIYTQKNEKRIDITNVPIIVMGNVCYQTNIDASPFKNLLLHADIGDVDINLSRESIQDNPKNRAWISKKIAEVNAQAKANFEAKIANEPAIYKAMVARQEFESKTGFSSEVQYRGEELPRAFVFSEQATGKILCSLSVVQEYGNRNGPYSGKINPKYLENKVIFADIKNGYIKAAKAYLKTLSKQDPSINNVVLIEGDLNEFLKITEYPQKEVEMCSKHYVKPVSASKRVSSHVLLFDPNKQGITNMSQARWWKDVNIDVKNHHKNTGKNLLYVLIDRYNLVNVKMADINSINELVDFSAYDVIGIKTAKQSFAVKHKLQHLDDYLKTKTLSKAEEDWLFNFYFTNTYNNSEERNEIATLKQDLWYKDILYGFISKKNEADIKNHVIPLTWKESIKANKLIKFDKNKVADKATLLAETIIRTYRRNANGFSNSILEHSSIRRDKLLQRTIYEGWKILYANEFKSSQNMATNSSVILP